MQTVMDERYIHARSAFFVNVMRAQKLLATKTIKLFALFFWESSERRCQSTILLCTVCIVFLSNVLYVAIALS